MAQRLRALAALAEDLGSVSCTYLAAHNCLKLGFLLLTSSETLHIHAGKTFTGVPFLIQGPLLELLGSTHTCGEEKGTRSDGGRVETGGILQRAPKSELERWGTHTPELEVLSQSGLR